MKTPEDEEQARPIRMLSVGLPSTLGSYLALTKQVFGETSPACKFIEDKISESPHGVDEEVVADETQVIQLLLAAHKNGYERG